MTSSATMGLAYRRALYLVAGVLMATSCGGDDGATDAASSSASTSSTTTTEPVDPALAAVADATFHAYDPERVVRHEGLEAEPAVMFETDQRIREAAVSPGGEHVAVVLADPDRSSNLRRLLVVAADGAVTEVAATEPGVDRRIPIDDPTWNADGSRLAFSWVRAGVATEVYTVAADGSDLVLATDPSGADWFQKDETPRWGGDPALLYWDSSRTRRGAIWRGAVDGSAKTEVTPAPEDAQFSNPAVSPDGRFLVAVNLRHEVWVVDLQTGDARAIGRSGPEINEFPSPPRWSPDGSRVAYLSYGRGDVLVVVEPATGEIRELGLGCQAFSHLWTQSDDHVLFSGDDCGGLHVLDVHAGESAVADANFESRLIGS